jgi:hypothetical protein
MQFSSAAARTERLGSDTCKRVRIDLASISPLDRRLVGALQYWNGLCKGKRLPARHEIDLFSLKPSMGWMHVVDTSAGTPEAYYYRLWGSRVGLDHGKNHTQMPLGEIPWLLLRNAVLTDYADVVATGHPAYHLVTHSIDYVRHSFARVLLPLANDGRRVDQLLVLINERPLASIEDSRLR